MKLWNAVTFHEIATLTEFNSDIYDISFKIENEETLLLNLA